jgi:hypothetical protein
MPPLPSARMHAAPRVDKKQKQKTKKALMPCLLRVTHLR